jgi:hypothetical protein
MTTLTTHLLARPQRLFGLPRGCDHALPVWRSQPAWRWPAALASEWRAAAIAYAQLAAAGTALSDHPRDGVGLVEGRVLRHRFGQRGRRPVPRTSSRAEAYGRGRDVVMVWYVTLTAGESSSK